MQPIDKGKDGGGIFTPKVVLASRVTYQLKNEVMQEASAFGQPVSEYIEVLLSNRHKKGEGTEKLKLQLAEKDKHLEDAQQRIKTLEAQIAEAKKNLLAEKSKLKPSVDDPLFDKRLLSHFGKLKGKSDVVQDPYADPFPIKYNTPRDVLTTLIYSVRIK